MRAQQQRDGSQLAGFTRFVYRAKISARSGQDSTQNRFSCLPPPGHNSRRTWSYDLWPRCTAARRTGEPCGGSGSRLNLFVHHHKTVIALVHRAARTNFGTGRVFTQWLQEMEIVGLKTFWCRTPLSSCQSPPAYSQMKRKLTSGVKSL